MSRYEGITYKGTDIEFEDVKAVENAAEAFSTSQAYATGDYCTYEGTLYQFVADHSAGAWNAAQVKKTTIGREVTDLKSEIIDSNFDSSGFNWVDNCYVKASDGTVGDSSSYSYFSAPVDSYFVLHVTSRFGSTTGICFYDENGNFVYGINNPNGGEFESDLQVPAGATTIKVSCVKNQKGSASISIPPKTLQKAIATQDAKIMEYVEEIDEKLDFQYKMDLDYVTGRLFSMNTKAWFNADGYVSAIIPAEGIENLHIVSGYAYGNTVPVVVYLSSDTPSSSSYIGNQGIGTSGSGKTFIQNVDCIIPDNCTYIILQGVANIIDEYPVFTKQTTIKEYAEINDEKIEELNNAINKRITYSLAGTKLSIKTAYGNRSLFIDFNKRGPNQLPDFTQINVDNTTLYGGSTDWIAPYIIAAKANIDGDDITHHYFTGGNHNYNNTGDSTGSATGRNISLQYYADGELLSDGDSGQCNEIQIVWINRIQGYNTRKEDGSGREILEETHVLVFDGVTACVTADIVPLEDVEIETWYGLHANVTNWPSIQYVGGNNRAIFNYLDNLSSGNATPNAMKCTGNNGTLEIEIDRTYDLGKGILYNENSGMFTSGTKAYCNIIKNSDLSKDDHYNLRGWFRFLPFEF